MRLGTSAIDITPNYPIELAGFAHRNGKAEKVFSKLYLKTFVYQRAQKHIILFIADLIWWDNAFIKEMQEKIEKKFHIPQHHIIFHATHNHSGPQISNRFSKQLGKPNQHYVDHLKKQVFQGIREAQMNIEEVNIELAKGTSDIGIYRRRKEDGSIVMEPNKNVPIDNELTVLSFIAKDRKAKAILIHYPCHPTTTDANIISREYTGICCREIKKEYPNSTIAFLQGFSADVRPALIKNDTFFRGNLKDTQRIGSRLAGDVMLALKNSEEVQTKDAFTCKRMSISLQFEGDEIENEAPSDMINEWKRMIERNTNYDLHIVYFRLNKNLAFIGCNAEMAQAYGTFIKQLDSTVLPLGYTNGMVGYIPTTEQLIEGGYEPEESIFYFGLPNRLSSTQEILIRHNFKEMIGEKNR